MTINIEDTTIPEVKILRSIRFQDERGFFSENYQERIYEEIGLPRFVQDNLSESKKGVIRGLHWQTAPFAQGKLVHCITGSIYDVAVDIRKTSPTFGKHIAIELNSLESKSLWIPEGFAHGFQALEENTRVLYKVTNYWNKTSEQSINYADNFLEINWRKIPVIISEKDRYAPDLQSILGNPFE